LRRISFGIFLVALVTLMVELLLTRVFDVLLVPNVAYLIITCALFSFGLSGIYRVFRPPPDERAIHGFLCRTAIGFSLATLAILPATNWLPFDFELFAEQPVAQLFAFLGLYLVLVIPFFLSGLIFATVFSAYASQIQRLYSWDLVGAAIGCVFLFPFLPEIGPGGLLFVSAAIGLLAAALFANDRRWAIGLSFAAVALVLPPAISYPEYIDFHPHQAKRGVKEAWDEGKIEFSRWDPVARIDVHDAERPFAKVKHVAYDGGQQSTLLYPFDGQYEPIRTGFFDHVLEHFWQRGVAASHYLLRDRGHQALVIGSAGGQEIKAALTFGAAHVDGVEMVGTVVELGLGRYADYIGRVFQDPRVSVQKGEGRSFLRSTDKRYDVIQIFSNHTSSSMAAGAGAMSPAYLQTADAYREYFTHLKDDGILHINHFIYPRMITTAALAWKQLGRDGFKRHVVVFARDGHSLPTLLIKMSPWTPDEMEDLRGFFSHPSPQDNDVYALVEDPLSSEASFLSDEFYSGELSEDLVARVPYRITPRTDDSPYFKFMRKRMGKLEPDPQNFVNLAAAKFLNDQLRSGIVPMDLIHLIVIGVVSLFYAVTFILVPLMFSKVGRSRWPHKTSTLIYFACLGAGFIIFELTFIQVFMRLVGYPLYTYSVVIFAMLASAGLGSYFSERVARRDGRRFMVPFLGILVTTLALRLVHDPVFDLMLAAPMGFRILVAGLLIAPLGFFLGMPFPLGILAIRNRPAGAVAWAWGLNGLFTVIGGLASVLLALSLGFRATLLIALLVYGVAFLVFRQLRAGLSEAPG
jgi:hypothetical protein